MWDDRQRRSPGDEPAVRVGDAERDACIDQLREAHTAGRLEIAEFTDRVGTALRARTTADLSHLLDDLPAARWKPPAVAARRAVLPRPVPATQGAPELARRGPVPPALVRRRCLVGAVVVTGLVTFAGVAVAGMGAASGPGGTAVAAPVVAGPLPETPGCADSPFLPETDRRCPVYRAARQSAAAARVSADRASVAAELDIDDAGTRALADEAAAAAELAERALSDAELLLERVASGDTALPESEVGVIVEVTGRRTASAAKSAADAAAAAQRRALDG